MAAVLHDLYFKLIEPPDRVDELDSFCADGDQIVHDVPSSTKPALDTRFKACGKRHARYR